MDRIEMREVADRVARELYRALKAQEIRAINIEIIEVACDAATSRLDKSDRDLLLDLTTRRVVELACAEGAYVEPLG